MLTGPGSIDGIDHKSMRWFFLAPKTYDKTNGYENIYNFRYNFSMFNWSLTH